MRRSTFARRILVLTTLIILLAAQARAQTCGDADGSGAVTVTDGVQTLRAAAGLSSTCTVARCDVDGSGAVSVTDGVNVLRKAAGLSAPDACPGGTSDGVQDALDAVLPFFAFGLDFASDLSLGSADAVVPAGGTENCPAGGTRTKFPTGPASLRIALDACGYSSPGLGNFEFDGGIQVNFEDSQVFFSFDVLDRDSGNVVNFNGLLGFVPRAGGGFTGAGAITLKTPQGDFSLVLNQLEVDGEGHVVGGGGSIADSAENNFALDRLTFQVTGPGTATLTAIFDDGTTNGFVLNLVTGDLTPS